MCFMCPISSRSVSEGREQQQDVRAGPWHDDGGRGRDPGDCSVGTSSSGCAAAAERTTCGPASHVSKVWDQGA